ncbi:MAG: right-handed parallel beta-helix repeat-containing protein, partial [Chloroflexota bacterium]|nr:right-handed parallel beta-helix repeat-containing protein [Chloroflexota bacterium]
VYNNYIGLKQDGQTMLGNRSDGVDMNLGSAGNIVGGLEPGQRNIISGNFSDGLEVSHSPYTDDFGTDFETKSNKIIGNYIGPSATGGPITRAGSAEGANSAMGITLEDNVEGTEIGHNVISDNGNSGIRMWSRISNSNIHDNKIGVGPDGVTPMPNGQNIDPKDVRKGHHGIYLVGDSDYNLIANNIIAHNKGYGVLISNAKTDYGDQEFLATDNNTVRRNSIYGNGDWEYLAPSGFTDTSDDKGIRLKAQDGDEPNLGMPRPTITRAYSNVVNGTATVAGGGPCAGCIVEVFVADTTTNFGEGRTFIGEATTGSDGSFAVPIGGIPAGTMITATATKPSGNVNEPSGNTSEFAQNKAVEAGPGPSPSPAPSPPPPKPVPTDKLYLPLIRRS